MKLSMINWYQHYVETALVCYREPKHFMLGLMAWAWYWMAITISFFFILTKTLQDMKLSMIWQEKGDLSIQVWLNRGDCMDRFDCIYLPQFKHCQSGFIQETFKLSFHNLNIYLLTIYHWKNQPDLYEV
jgi:hypothetical protein